MPPALPQGCAQGTCTLALPSGPPLLSSALQNIFTQEETPLGSVVVWSQP